MTSTLEVGSFVRRVSGVPGDTSEKLNSTWPPIYHMLWDDIRGTSIGYLLCFKPISKRVSPYVRRGQPTGTICVGRQRRPDAELCRSEGDRRVGLSRRQLSSDDMGRHEFAPDSALEGAGFELSVPLKEGRFENLL